MATNDETNKKFRFHFYRDKFFVFHYLVIYLTYLRPTENDKEFQ